MLHTIVNNDPIQFDWARAIQSGFAQRCSAMFYEQCWFCLAIHNFQYEAMYSIIVNTIMFM